MQYQDKEDKWVVTYKDNGDFWYCMSLEEHNLRKFAEELFVKTVMAPAMWGKPKITDKTEISKIAKEIYEKDFKDKFPINYLEYYNK